MDIMEIPTDSPVPDGWTPFLTFGEVRKLRRTTEEETGLIHSRPIMRMIDRNYHLIKEVDWMMELERSKMREGEVLDLTVDVWGGAGPDCVLSLA